MGKNELKERYLSSVSFYLHLEKTEDKILLLLSVSRFVVFTGGLILAWIAFSKSVFAGIILMILLIVLFLCLIKRFSDHSKRKEFLRNLILINQNEAEALSGNFSAFDEGSSYIDIRHDFSFDVDLFGASSLFQYLNRTVTGYGRDILAGWLSDPFKLAGNFAQRQEAISELASKDKWRHQFMASGMRNTP